MAIPSTPVLVVDSDNGSASVNGGPGGLPVRSDSLPDIIAEHTPRVRAIIRGILYYHRQDWEDIEQTVWLHVVMYLSQFRGESSIGTWIYHITINTCYDYLRKVGYSRTVRIGDLDPDLAERVEQYSRPEDGIDTILARSDLLIRLLSTVTPEDRSLLLRTARGDSLAEISADTGLGVGTLKSRLFRLRQTLAGEYARLERTA